MQATFSVFALLAVAAPLCSAVPIASDLFKRQSYTGDATFYEPGLGACGEYSSSSDYIAAVPIGYGKGECGKQASITRGDKSVTVTVVDLCGGCADGDIDLSPAAFNQIASPDEGRVTVSWTLGGGSSSPNDNAVSSEAAAATEPTPAPEPTYTPEPVTTDGQSNGGETCVEGTIVCNGDNTWSQCGSGILQLQGAVPPGMTCTDGTFVAA